MPATRTCPRCGTENDVDRSNCLQCGGVMLGVGFSLDDAEQSPNAAVSRANPADPQVAHAIRARLDKVKNLSPEKKAQIAEALEQRLAGRITPTVTTARKPALVFATFGLMLALSVGFFLFFQQDRVVEASLQQANAAKLAAQHAQPPTLPVQPTPPVQPDPVDPAHLEAPLADPQGSAHAPDQTLTRAQARPLRSCFRNHGVPAERPMSFGISVEAKGAALETTVFAMTDVQVPPGVVKCIQQHTAFLHWPPGVRFVDWPNEPDWP